jgi:hypothetical protein
MQPLTQRGGQQEPAAHACASQRDRSAHDVRERREQGSEGPFSMR